jgi:hypothetical protein
LLIDEGEDVLQLVKEPEGYFSHLVPSKRRRLRSVFIFAKERVEEPFSDPTEK